MLEPRNQLDGLHVTYEDDYEIDMLEGHLDLEDTLGVDYEEYEIDDDYH